MSDATMSADEALNRFIHRIRELQEELASINTALGRQGLLHLASRTHELLRRTKGLLDGNVALLFAGEPDRVSEELYSFIGYAEGHITAALSTEYEFDAIEKRLYMATGLAQYVIAAVATAIDRLVEDARTTPKP